MRNCPNLKVEKYRKKGTPGTHCGAFLIHQPHGRPSLLVVSSAGAGWEHVSVSTPTRTPSWAEMDHVCRLFWRDDETVMQLHVPPGDNISNHEFCLHLWKPMTDAEIAAEQAEYAAGGEVWPFGSLTAAGPIPRPPDWMVGVKGNPESLEKAVAELAAKLGVENPIRD